jgi:hypothetical protein
MFCLPICYLKTERLKYYFTCCLYGCEIWSLTLRDENRLRVFENRVLKRILGHKRVELIEGWRRLRNEAFHNLFSCPNIINMIKSNIGSYLYKTKCKWQNKIRNLSYELESRAVVISQNIYSRKQH